MNARTDILRAEIIFATRFLGWQDNDRIAAWLGLTDGDTVKRHRAWLADNPDFAVRALLPYQMARFVVGDGDVTDVPAVLEAEAQESEVAEVTRRRERREAARARSRRARQQAKTEQAS